MPGPKLTGPHESREEASIVSISVRQTEDVRMMLLRYRTAYKFTLTGAFDQLQHLLGFAFVRRTSSSSPTTRPVVGGNVHDVAG